MNLRNYKEYAPNPSQRVIIRIDADVPKGDNSRLEKSISTFLHLIQNGGKVALIGHMGRPEGKYVEELSLRRVYQDFMKLAGVDVDSKFMENFDSVAENQVLFYENLRFWPGEETNDNTFMKNLIEKVVAYINDAPAVAHRKHASIMLHEVLPTYYGESFIKEIGKLGDIYEKIRHPVSYILGGKKEDKLKNIKTFLKTADNIFLGGRLPTYVEDKNQYGEKVYVSQLRQDLCDLNDNDIKVATDMIGESKTMIVVGAPGWFEKEEYKKGTESIAKALTNNKDSIVIFAGGDTGASFKKFGVEGPNIVQVSGGGSTLEYLATGRLAALPSTS